MVSRILWSDVDGPFGSVGFEVEELAGLTVQKHEDWEEEEDWDEEEDEEEWEGEEGEDVSWEDDDEELYDDEDDDEDDDWED